MGREGLIMEELGLLGERFLKLENQLQELITYVPDLFDKHACSVSECNVNDSASKGRTSEDKVLKCCGTLMSDLDLTRMKRSVSESSVCLSTLSSGYSATFWGTHWS